MSAPEVITFGCRLNAYESEIMQRNALAAGLEDAVIVNTCTVTAEAERQARQSIRRLRRERPEAKIIVTGCASHVHRDAFEAMAEVDHIIANDRKTETDSFLEIGRHPGARRDPVANVREQKSILPHIQETLDSGLRRNDERSVQRAFVQIQNGCDHRCTFCIIPFGRGASRSMTAARIAEDVRARVAEGFNEVVFTGVDIASYGGDLPGKPRLGAMIRQVLELVPELPWLRLSSIDPAAMDDDLWRLVAGEPRLLPHLHLSVQAGDDMILKRMKRRHLRDDVIKLCQRARELRPDIVFGADFIAGFPTETESMFHNTLALAEQCGMTWLHVFPYSARSGTPAAKMPQVNAAIRRERAERLRQLGDKAASRHRQKLIGHAFDALVERRGLCCTKQFAKLDLQGEAPPGVIVRVECFAGADGQAVTRLAA